MDVERAQRYGVSLADAVYYRAAPNINQRVTHMQGNEAKKTGGRTFVRNNSGVPPATPGHLALRAARRLRVRPLHLPRISARIYTSFFSSPTDA